VFPIEIPPLRDRLEDLPLLTSFFVSRLSKRLGKHVERISKATIGTLAAYDWPGNVRELQSVIEHALIMSPGDKLRLPSPLGQARRPCETAGSLAQDIRGIERNRILVALEASGWKIKGEGNAAGRLGLKPSSLRTRMKRLGIERPS
jgi:transcriptional regulator with GAF, ATPase, and Fis domain